MQIYMVSSGGPVTNRQDAYAVMVRMRIKPFEPRHECRAYGKPCDLWRVANDHRRRKWALGSWHVYLWHTGPWPQSGEDGENGDDGVIH